jgi:hypothetical protein
MSGSLALQRFGTECGRVSISQQKQSVKARRFFFPTDCLPVSISEPDIHCSGFTFSAFIDNIFVTV